MTNISSTSPSASQVNSAGHPIGTVEATENIQNVVPSTSAQDVPVTQNQEHAAKAPVLPAPGTTDYAGATNFAAMFTELIVLMCEVNRDSYEANRETARLQMEARVGQLEEAAKKSRNAAIVGLAMSVVSAGVSIAGATVTTASSMKNMSQLSTTTKTGQPGATTPQSANSLTAGTPDAPQTAPGMNQSQTVTMDSQGSAKAQTLEANVTQDTKTVQSTKTTNAADDAPANAADLDQRAAMARVESNTVRNQVMTMVFSTMSSLTSSVGQSTASMINANAETVRASAEAIEAERQVSTSSAQQYQELMSKFNSILSSYLEAEIRAASAAAQV